MKVDYTKPIPIVKTNGAAQHKLPPRLGDSLDASILRADRRCKGIEKPLPIPWSSLNDHFGGGLWQGVHFLNSGTGVGKTQLALQWGLGIAKAGTPVLYVGLELNDFDCTLRVLGEEAGVKWSHLWTGKAGPAHVEKVRAAVPNLRDLPFYCEFSRPMGFPVSAVVTSVEALRHHYPELDGPGSRPIFVVLDFLQLIGSETKDDGELRVRIGQASYALKDLSNRLGAAILVISSVARERYKTMSDLLTVAGLKWDEDADGCPVNRRILEADAIIGVGKESGEIEFSGDSVSVVGKVPGTWNGSGCDVVFATAKGRATGSMWSPLHFTGWRYEECSDRGGRMVDAWKNAEDKRAKASEEKKAAKEQKKGDKIDADARAVAAYILANPDCTVGSVRTNVVNATHTRWTAASERLGKALVQTKEGRSLLCRIDTSKLESRHAS